MNKQHFDEIRMKRNISLEKLSELTLIPISTLTKISAGKIKTSFENMCRIAKALECSLDDLADCSPSSSSLTPDDRTLIKQFHSLSSQNQYAIHMIFEMEKNDTLSTSSKTHKVLCYIPISYECNYFFQNSLTIATISLPDIYHYTDVAFAWRITNCAYVPYFFQSDFLLFKCHTPMPDEIALFQQGEHIFLCRYTLINNTELLQPISAEQCPSKFLQKEKCRCLGTLHSIIRANSPLAEKINLKL